MGFRNREIETKLILKSYPSLDSVAIKVQKLFGYKCRDIIVGHSRDTYWKAPAGAKADFVRLRYFQDGTGQLTVKFSDRGTNVDRVELDLFIKDPKQARLVLIQLFGKPVGTVRKKYFVYFLENEHTTISVYKVDGDRRIFVEAEATTNGKMVRMINRLKKIPWEFYRSDKSLYQLFLS